MEGMTMATFKLGDDGTLDTVVVCDGCGEELRYNYDPEGSDENVSDEEAYDNFVEWALEDAAEQHECYEDRHECIRRSGRVEIRLNYNDSDNCYEGMVRVDGGIPKGGHTYSLAIGAPAAGYGPGIAYDSPEAFDRAAHAALSFAADDKEWGEGEDIFTPAADMDDKGWVLTRVKG